MNSPRQPEGIDQLIAAHFAIEGEAAKENGALGFMARALVQATLPHRRAEGCEFIRRNGEHTLTLYAPTQFGLPFGTIPRLLIAWMTLEAVKTKSRELVLGDSLSAFMRQLDLVPTGGRWGSVTRLRRQTLSLFSSTITFHSGNASKDALAGLRIADEAELWWKPRSPAQAALWKSTVLLTEKFYEEVTTRPVPIDLRAICALKKSPLALDIYCWLTHRFSYLSRPTDIHWPGLAAQFGSNYNRPRAFKEAFLDALKKVQVVYPEAQVSESVHGILLKPSRPHVTRKMTL